MWIERGQAILKFDIDRARGCSDGPAIERAKQESKSSNVGFPALSLQQRPAGQGRQLEFDSQWTGHSPVDAAAHRLQLPFTA